jgi:hypothetical protein
MAEAEVEAVVCGELWVDQVRVGGRYLRASRLRLAVQRRCLLILFALAKQPPSELLVVPGD